MFWLTSVKQTRTLQCGQILAEAVVVSLLLVTLLLAIHQSARLQHQWQVQWLTAQVAATAASQSHKSLPGGVRQQQGPVDHWRTQAMREYGIGRGHWLGVQTTGPLAQQGWRLVGSGQASLTDSVVQRIEQAPQLWRATATRSKAVIASLWPTLAAVQAPWADRGSATQWLKPWQDSAPAGASSNRAASVRRVPWR